MPNAKPQNYGQWWNEANTSPDWYHQLFEPRRMVHEQFVRWVKDHGPFENVLEIGSGSASFYPKLFAGSCYTGVDISKKEIDQARKLDP